MLGHETQGVGRSHVIVLNDWLCDTTTWDCARAYLDGIRFTWAFADLRGYGRSRGQTGRFTVEEAAADVLELADAKAWPSVAVVGHSMSTLVALHMAQRWPERVHRAVLLTPPPPSGFGADDARLAMLRATALGDDALRMGTMGARFGARLSAGWARFKVQRWRETSDPEAVAAYAPMFARRGLPDQTTRVRAPVLAITGEQDLENMRREAVVKALAPLCERLEVTPLADSGHYPMQEAPALLVAIVERFLAE
jgi:pimeloyl-ACP methyl ester carboxylesterase